MSGKVTGEEKVVPLCGLRLLIALLKLAMRNDESMTNVQSYADIITRRHCWLEEKNKTPFFLYQNDHRKSMDYRDALMEIFHGH